MKFMIQFLIFAECLLLNGVAQANTPKSQLIVEYNAPDLEARITTDLVCDNGAPYPFYHSARYTTPLEENPIHHKGRIKAGWQNCWLLPENYFKAYHIPDHSKIYLSLTDIKTGDQFIAVMNIRTGTWSREIEFSNHHVKVNLSLDVFGMYRFTEGKLQITEIV